ncbi:MAG: cytochrome c3 family protein [Fidelibacterota bacterium]
MKHPITLSILLLTILLVAVGGQDPAPVNECLECHLDLDEEFAEPAELFPQDVHAQNGFTCADCHGGDPTTDDMDEAKDPETGFIGVPTPKEVPFLCGKCHSDPVFMQKFNPALPVDQVAKYWSSFHGKGLLKGDPGVATCASCHQIHSILPKSDPPSRVYPTNVASTCNHCHGDEELMSLHGLPATAYDDYRASVHGVALLERQDLSAPTCNDCHGNHGAIPPGVSSVKMICGQCHPNNQQIFESTKMSKVIETKGLHGCVVCHSNHRIPPPTDAMISLRGEGVCQKCHSPGDEGAQQVTLIRSALDGLIQSISESEQKITDAENLGMEVDDALFDIQSAKEILIKSRVMIHSLDGEEVRKTAVPGLDLSERARTTAVAAISDSKNRKIGLGISTVIITFLAVVLYLYIRRLER